MRLYFLTTVDVDEEGWTLSYGQEAADDAPEYVRETIEEAVRRGFGLQANGSTLTSVILATPADEDGEMYAV